MMRRSRVLWVAAALALAPTASRAQDPCRGGILFGTLWAPQSGGWTAGVVWVHAIGRDGARVLASTRTDGAGRYRLCGLPMRTPLDLVGVPDDPSRGVHIVPVTISVPGGQQSNLYPGETLRSMPPALTPTLAGSGRPDPEPTAAVVPPAGPVRVITADSLLVYFTDDAPRYLRLAVVGLDGRGCFFEFDAGLDGQSVTATGGGYDLHSPSWGVIRVERPSSGEIILDLDGVYTPACRSRTSGGARLRWVHGPGGWTQPLNS